MVRLALLALFALVVPSCYLANDFDDDDIDDPPSDGPQCNYALNICVTKDNPFRFAFIPRFGAGTELEVPFVAHSSLGIDFEIVASDPSIEVIRDGNHVVLRAHKAGTFTLTANNTATQTELTHTQFDTADVASFDFSLRFAPVETDPLTSVAALLFATDAIGVHFRDGNGSELAGSAPVTVDDPAIVKVQQPASGWSQVDGSLGGGFNITGQKIGTTVATVTMFDGRTATLPIEVVGAPATVEIALVKFLTDGRIVAVAGPVAVNDLLDAVVVAKTSDGRFVAGVVATWTGTGPALITASPGDSRLDVEVIPMAAGTIVVTARTPGFTATATVVAH
jgi:hypothetical protein